MSHASYNVQWQKVMEDLYEQIGVEQNPPTMDGSVKTGQAYPVTWNTLHVHLSHIFVRYLQIMRKQEECYDQIVHPQKRRDIRITLDLIISRIYQQQFELSTYGPGGQQSDFHSQDFVLNTLKQTPDALEVPIPLYFRERQHDDEVYIQNRIQLARSMDEQGISPDNTNVADGSVSNSNNMGNTANNNSNILLSHLTRSQAIAIIQKNERGRQGVQKALLAKEIQLDNAVRVKNRMGVGLERSVHTAAIIIQRHVRGWLVRKRVKQDAYDELVFLEMLSANTNVDGGNSGNRNAGNNGYDPVSKEAQVRRTRKAKQADHEQQYIEDLHDATEFINSAVSSELKDKLWEERYQWWITQHQKNGKAPKDLNGFYLAQKEEEEKKKNVTSLLAADDEVTTKNTGRSTASRSSGRGKKEEPPIMLQSSPIVPLLLDCLDKYQRVWMKLNESKALAQTHDKNMVREHQVPLAKEALRETVDQELTQYLQSLQGKIKKKGKKRSTKAATGTSTASRVPSRISSRPSTSYTGPGEKKPVKRGKKKLEGSKLCAQMTTSGMMSALVQLGIIKDTSTHRGLSDFKGEANPVGSQIEAVGVRRDATLQQLRQAIVSTYVLPLGCKVAKSYGPVVNSLLLVGAKGSGKSLLIEGIAKSTHCVWFDLSPANVLSKVRNKADVQKLCYMLFRVAQDVQPAVIHIDGAEQQFFQKGKGPKGRSALLAQLRKSIIVQRKALPADARILIAGSTSQPTIKNISTKEICKFFDSNHKGRIWFCPAPDYNTRLKLWRYFITHCNISVPALTSISPDLHLSLLAKVSEGFTAGAIEIACKHTLTASRVERLKNSPTAKFYATELLRTLSKTTYMYQNEYTAYANFMLNVTGEAKRIAMLQTATIIDAEIDSKKKDKVKVRPNK